MSLNRDEKSLLMFLETQAVDQGGLVNLVRMNEDDHAILKRWTESGFVKSGRVCSADIERLKLSSGRTKQRTMWAQLSEDAFEAAHKERRARAKRMWKSRSWQTTDEKRDLVA